MAVTISCRSSPTTDLNRTAIPNLPSSSARKREMESYRPPINSSVPMAMVSAVSGRVADALNMDSREQSVLVNLAKIYGKARLSSIRRIHNNRRLGPRIEVGIVERRHNLRLEPRSLRPNDAALGLCIESHYHGLDRLPALIEHHVTVHRKV